MTITPDVVLDSTKPTFELKITKEEQPDTSAPAEFRDGRVIDHYLMQQKLYNKCDCGSGKKFKFCCRITNTEPTKEFKLKDLVESYATKPVPMEEEISDADWESKRLP